MDNAGKTGAWGEVVASRYLRENGYAILAANYRTRFGEIDLIACKDGYLAFIEVKTRRSGGALRPCESVDTGKQRKIIRTASLYLSAHPSQFQPRFDVIEICLKKKDAQVEEINHMKNAFTMEAASEYF